MLLGCPTTILLKLLSSARTKTLSPRMGLALRGISEDEDFDDLLLPLVNPEEIDRLLPFCQNLRSMKFASIPCHIMDREGFVQALNINILQVW